uniref:Uncharacterized protein n=1 Tax=Anopheles coluzzii TaxID=1518534 RepID=A0A8W7PZV7_ANOCL
MSREIKPFGDSERKNYGRVPKQNMAKHLASGRAELNGLPTQILPESRIVHPPPSPLMAFDLMDLSGCEELTANQLICFLLLRLIEAVRFGGQFDEISYELYLPNDGGGKVRISSTVSIT